MGVQKNRLVESVFSFLIIFVVSIPLGVFIAKHSGGVIDRVLTVLNQIIMSIPAFFSGIIITLVFGLILGLFTPGGFVSYKTDVAGFLGYLIFPSVAIAIPKISMTVKLLKESILEEYKNIIIFIVFLLLIISLLKYSIAKECEKRDWGNFVLELPIDVCLVVITIIITGIIYDLLYTNLLFFHAIIFCIIGKFVLSCLKT